MTRNSPQDGSKAQKKATGAITLLEFTESYTQSLGVEGARRLLTEVLTKLGLDDKREFSRDEAILICKELKQKPGFIGIVAGILSSRFMLR